MQKPNETIPNPEQFKFESGIYDVLVKVNTKYSGEKEVELYDIELKEQLTRAEMIKKVKSHVQAAGIHNQLIGDGFAGGEVILLIKNESGQKISLGNYQMSAGGHFQDQQ